MSWAILAGDHFGGAGLYLLHPGRLRVESAPRIPYTPRVMTFHFPRRRRWLAVLAIALVALDAWAAGKSPGASARELEALQKRIGTLEKEVARAASARPTAGKALKEAEVREADAREALRDIRSRLAAGREREKLLRADIARAEEGIAMHRAGLESQLRLAYAAGREEWVRLALTQQDPVALSRRVVYYGYITRQRSALLAELQAEAEALQAAAAALRAELESLADLGRHQETRVREVAAARVVRATALQTLERDLGSRKQKLERLRRDARALRDLMARLDKESRTPARKEEPEPAALPALQVKNLPLQGRTLARFGQPRADGLLRWDGMLLGAPAGTEVRAVRPGRVVYADWLPGMGMLVVVDHGRGIMSLYGHNQEILKRTGQSVRQGETLARVGDSGGEGTPGLYFEVRRNGKPVDPRDWVR
jgi:septal ring factor EnvC (AmiA/AmiB activator)